MCLAICYLDANRIIITYFSETTARLPIKTKNNEIKPLLWGRRQHEAGVLPLGGWISLDHLKQNKWDYYFPKPVKIPIKKFMEKDIEGSEQWFDIGAGQWVQGVILQEGTEQRVYIVTVMPQIPNNPYPRWPRIVTN